MSTANRICPPHIQELPEYSFPERPPIEKSIWINANEWPEEYTFSDPISNLNRYPECQPRTLIDAYSHFCHQPAENIMITRGADEGIELLIRTFCTPRQDRIAVCPSTYGMYSVAAQTCFVKVHTLAMDEHFNIMPPSETMLEKSDCKIVFICHPNNPTGNPVPQSLLESFVQVMKNKALVVVDQAYVEYCMQEDISPLIQRYDNLVVLRTLSKSFGLAGLRCGFILAQPSILALLQKVLPPFPIPTPTATIASYALQPPLIDRMHQRTLQTIATRDYFIKRMQTLSCVEHVFPSLTSFVLVRFYDAISCLETLRNHQIIARPYHTQPGLKNCIRFSTGTADQMESVIQTLT